MELKKLQISFVLIASFLVIPSLHISAQTSINAEDFSKSVEPPVSGLDEIQPITRMVFFNLKHEAGSPEAETFFKNALVLKEVPSLSDFEILKVEGKQFDFDYVIRLVFEDRQGVEDYVNHKIHIDYLEEEWKPNVTGGMLIDLLGLLPEE